MRKKLLLIILVLQLLLVSPVWAEVEFSADLFVELAGGVNEAPYIETPDYKRIELENGMVVYLAEARTTNRRGVGYIKVDSVRNPGWLGFRRL